MSNTTVVIGNLGREPEALELGGRPCMKLRIAEKAGSKRAETRWFNAIIGGPDVETAKKLAKGDTIAVTGELVYTKFKKKGAKDFTYEDEMPFAKLMRVIKSPTFFAGEGGDAPAGEPTADAPAGDTPPDLSDLD
jgi:single-stranded DNA-binding protein